MLVKQLTLRLSSNPNPMNGDQSGPEADAELMGWTRQGWEIKTAQAIGVDQGAMIMYYCLVHQPTIVETTAK